LNVRDRYIADIKKTLVRETRKRREKSAKKDISVFSRSVCTKGHCRQHQSKYREQQSLIPTLYLLLFCFFRVFCVDVHGRTNVAGAWSAGATFADYVFVFKGQLMTKLRHSINESDSFCQFKLELIQIIPDFQPVCLLTAPPVPFRLSRHPHRSAVCFQHPLHQFEYDHSPH